MSSKYLAGGREANKRGQNMGRNITHGSISRVSTLGRVSICGGQSQLSKPVCSRLNWYDGNKINYEPAMLLLSCRSWMQKICATHCTFENWKVILGGPPGEFFVPRRRALLERRLITYVSLAASEVKVRGYRKRDRVQLVKKIQHDWWSPSKCSRATTWGSGPWGD